jgi:hypothetical protein
MYDLRERVMLDIMKRKTITNGQIEGTFRFISDNGQMLLVPEDSHFVVKADAMAVKVPVKPIPFKTYSNKLESEFFLVIDKKECIKFGYGNYATLANPIMHSYIHPTPKTLYDCKFQVNLGESPVEGFTHMVADIIKSREHDYFGYYQSLIEKIGQKTLFIKLLAHKELIQLPRNPNVND